MANGDEGAQETASAAGEASWAEARRRREQALRALAKGATPAAATEAAGTTPVTLAPRRRSFKGLGVQLRWRIALILTTVVLLAAVIGAAVLTHRQRPSQQQTFSVGKPVRLNVGGSFLACEQAGVWSPDGAHFALLGYESRCPTQVGSPDGTYYLYAPGAINIYSRDGGILQELHPDQIIDSALHLTAPTAIGPAPRSYGGDGAVGQTISYGQMVWSKDGSRLVVLFSVGVITALGSPQQGGQEVEQVTEGVLVLDASGGQSQVFSYREPTPNVSRVGVWDLQTGELVPFPPGIGLYQQTFPAPALGYYWNGLSGLQPQQPLTLAGVPPAPSLSPVGSPEGDASFSVWQPATISPVYMGGSPGSPSLLRGVYNFSAVSAAIAPDGRYFTLQLLEGILVQGATETPTADMLRQNGFGQTGLLPVRDKALAAVLTDLDGQVQAAAAENFNQPSVQVAWSPDGRTLAAFTSRVTGRDNNGNPTFTYAVTLYDCASGKQLTKLTPVRNFAGQGQGYTTLLSWSADGTRLLLFAPELNALSLWTVQER